jgi:hypothetical protein
LVLEVISKAAEGAGVLVPIPIGANNGTEASIKKRHSKPKKNDFIGV